jgi:hypothetical protein
LLGGGIGLIGAVVGGAWIGAAVFGTLIGPNVGDIIGVVVVSGTLISSSVVVAVSVPATFSPLTSVGASDG